MTGPRGPTGAPTAPPTPTLLEAAVIVALCFGWFIYGSLLSMGAALPSADAAEGGTAAFSDAGLQGLLISELLLGAVALGFLRWRGHTLRSVLPSPSVRGGLIGLALWGGSLLGWWVLASWFTPAEQAAQPIVQMTSQARLSTQMVLAVSIVNGLYEEVFVLGFLVRAFERWGASLAIGVSVLVRLLYHLYQGPMGALYVCFFGLLMGLYYWRTRSLWPVVFAHMVADLVGLS